MMIEAQCNICHKHIGYASMAGKGISPNISIVRTISSKYVTITLVCDKCQDGLIDLEAEGDEE